MRNFFNMNNSFAAIKISTIFIPYCTLLVRFGATSCEFHRATWFVFRRDVLYYLFLRTHCKPLLYHVILYYCIVLCLVIEYLTSEPDMPLKRTKNLWLGMYRTRIRPGEHDIVAISGQWLDIVGFQDSKDPSDWLIANLGTVSLRIWFRDSK